MKYLHRKPRHIEKQEYYSRRIILQRKLKRILLLVAFLLPIWLLVAGDMGLWAMWQSVKYERKLSALLEYEKKRAAELNEMIQRLDSDTLFIEQVARTKLGMLKDNEKVFIFLNDSTPQNTK